MEEDGSDENVDCPMSAYFSRCRKKSINLQIPRPRNENKNEAYRETWGGIWNSNAPMAGEVSRHPRIVGKGGVVPSPKIIT